MKNFCFVFAAFFFLLNSQSEGADYSDGNVRKNDSKWAQFNLYYGFDNKIPFNNQRDTFFEMEFGGRSGVLDLYGFLDVFDVTHSPQSDLHNEDNMFLKFVPRFSLDGMFKKDLSVGPVLEWYLADMILIADRGLFQHYVGVGTDTEIPWFGKSWVNLLARYVSENYGAANEDRWDGYFLHFGWYKPFYTFADKSFLTYQGYFDYTFGADKLADSPDYSDSSLEWFNGFYWNVDHYAVGYGLKYYKDMALRESGGSAGTTTGFGHYFSLTYRF